jgi:hypothetical protein
MSLCKACDADFTLATKNHFSPPYTPSPWASILGIQPEILSVRNTKAAEKIHPTLQPRNTPSELKRICKLVSQQPWCMYLQTYMLANIHPHHLQTGIRKCSTSPHNSFPTSQSSPQILFSRSHYPIHQHRMKVQTCLPSLI